MWPICTSARDVQCYIRSGGAQHTVRVDLCIFMNQPNNAKMGGVYTTYEKDENTALGDGTKK